MGFQKIFGNGYVNGVSINMFKSWWHFKVIKKVQENVRSTSITRTRSKKPAGVSCQCKIVEEKEWLHVSKVFLKELNGRDSQAEEPNLPLGEHRLDKMSKTQRENELSRTIIEYLEDPMR